MKVKVIASATYFNMPDGKIEVTFKNELSGETFKNTYKTQAAATAQVTKFYNKIQSTL